MICCSKFGDWWFGCGCHVELVIVDVMFWVYMGINMYVHAYVCVYMPNPLFVWTFVCFY